MPTLLKLGANVSGLKDIERLATSLEEVAIAAQHVDTSTKVGSQQVKILAASMKTLAADAELAAAAMRNQQASAKAIGNNFGYAVPKAKAFHAAIRGISGAMGGLWLTYGSILPMLAGFGAITASMKTLNIGSDLDYTARNIEILNYGFDTLSKNADLANASLAGTKKAILDIQDSVFSPGDLAKGVLEFSRAGFNDFESSLKGVEAASQFAYIGQMDLSKAVELVVGQMTAFNKESLSATAAFNIMSVVADNTSVDLQQMTDAFKNTTSLGTVLGLKFDDVAVALGALGQAGIRGATAGAALNTMMYKLIAPTETAKRKMDELGITFSAFDEKTGQMKSIRTIAFELADMAKTLGLSTKDMGAVFESMVGLRGVKALGALVSMARDNTKKFNELSEAVKNTNSYLDGYMSLLEKSGKVQMDMLKADFSKVFASAYTDAEPAFVEAIKSVRELLKDPALVGGVSAIAEGTAYLVKIAADGTKSVVDFVAAIDSIIPIKEPVLATLAGIASGVEQISKLAAETRRQQKSGESWIKLDFNPMSTWDEYSKSVDNLFSGKSIKQSIADTVTETNKLAEAAKKAKEKFTEINGVKVPVYSLEEEERLGKIEEYFDNIRNKVIEANSTPLQIVNAKVEQDLSNMLSQLSQAGLTLDQMIELTDNYIGQIERLGTAGGNSANKIEEIGKALEKAGGDKGKISELKDNLTQLSKAMNHKEMVKANAEMVKDMRKSWQDYADKVTDIQKSIVDNQRTLAGELRAIDQSNMVGMKLWNDKKKEVGEYKQAAIEAAKSAQAAFAAGDKVTGESQYKLAEEYFKQATEAAKGLNTQVTADTSAINQQAEAYKNNLDRLKAIRDQQEIMGKDTTYADAQIAKYQKIYDYFAAEQQKAASTVVVPKLQGANEAKTQLQDLYSTWTQLQTRVQEAMKKPMDELKKEAEAATGGQVDMTKGMDESKAKFIKNWLEANKEITTNYTQEWENTFDAWLEKGSDNISELQDQLNELIKDREMTVTVTMVQANSIGGLIGGYQNGGLIQALASGGSVKNVLGGAYLPGFGGGDRRLLLGEDGEVMLNKWVTKAGGVDTALAYNNGDFGTVIDNLATRFPSLTSGRSDGSMEQTENHQTVVWKFEDTGETAKMKASPYDIDVIQRGIKRRERLRS